MDIPLYNTLRNIVSFSKLSSEAMMTVIDQVKKDTEVRERLCLALCEENDIECLFNYNKNVNKLFAKRAGFKCNVATVNGNIERLFTYIKQQVPYYYALRDADINEEYITTRTRLARFEPVITPHKELRNGSCVYHFMEPNVTVSNKYSLLRIIFMVKTINDNMEIILDKRPHF